MTPRPHSLRARVVLAVVAAVVTTSLLFSLAAFAIAYSAEDRLFARALVEEVAHQKSAWKRTRVLAAPDNPAVTVHRSYRTLPSDIRQQAAENPGQTEFYGRQGRHYHTLPFDLNDDHRGISPSPAIAVIEVSGDLLVRPFRNSIVQFLGWMSLIIAVVMAGFAWWLANRAMKPLSNLASDVANATSAIPSLHAANYPANEIGLLAEALEQAFARIRGFVEREQAFTRDASHELRTPLAVIRGAAEVIALNRDLRPYPAEPLRRIETATTDITLALDQLLALAREHRGVVREQVDLRLMIEKAVSWSRVRHPNSAINVLNKVDGSAVAFVHPPSLQLVLNNLIGNCFQHVENGELVVEFQNGCLSIADDGPGFNDDTESFAPFAKGSSSLGSGLGLDISRRLCDAANIGLITGERKISRGASFRLDLRAP